MTIYKCTGLWKEEYIIIITYSKEDADDLYQETFLRAFEQLPKLSNLDNPQGFLFSTSLYIWKSLKRKYARRKRLVPMEPLDDTVASDINMEDNFLIQEETRIESLSKNLASSILYYSNVNCAN